MSGRASQAIGKAEQQHVVALYRSVGAQVYVLGTTRRRGDRCPSCHAFVPNRDHGTHQTPGVADLAVFLPHRSDDPARFLWHEVKAGSGRLSADQVIFRDWCVATGIEHVVGGLDAAIAYLVRIGRARVDQFTHYRTTRMPG